MSFCVHFWTLNLKMRYFHASNVLAHSNTAFRDTMGTSKNEACLCDLNMTKTTEGSCSTVTASYLSLIIINHVFVYFSTPEGQTSYHSKSCVCFKPLLRECPGLSSAQHGALLQEG